MTSRKSASRQEMYKLFYKILKGRFPKVRYRFFGISKMYESAQAECARTTPCRDSESYVARMDQLLLQVREMDDRGIVDIHKPAISQVVKELPKVFGQKSVLLVAASLQDEPCHVCSLATETPMIGGGRSLIWKSRVMREYQARFCESLGVQLPLATRPFLCLIVQCIQDPSHANNDQKKSRKADPSLELAHKVSIHLSQPYYQKLLKVKKLSSNSKLSYFILGGAYKHTRNVSGK